MPYELFSNDARLSKAYPTEADVWKVARTSGLVVGVASEEEEAERDAWTASKKLQKAKAKGGAA